MKKNKVKANGDDIFTMRRRKIKKDNR